MIPVDLFQVFQI